LAIELHFGSGLSYLSPRSLVLGFDAVMKLFERLAALFHETKLVRAGFVNGLPGFITLEADGELQTTALEIEDGKVAANLRGPKP